MKTQYAMMILNKIAKYINKIYLCRMKEYASEVQNIFSMESWIEEHRIYLIGNKANMTHSGKIG